MNSAVELPALDGRLPLGFLAALGLLKIMDDTCQGTIRLSFTAEHGTAVLHSPLKSVADIAGHLAAVVTAIPAKSVIPGLTPGFPAAPGSGKDPMRPPHRTYRQFATDISRTDPQAAGQWLPHLVTDLAIDRQGRADITPFMAPRAKQNMRTFFGESLKLTRSTPEYLEQALASWRRVPGVTGEYLDYRALNSPVDDPAGMKKAERGVPGATWLATMAIPMLRLTGDGSSPAATLWHRAGRRNIMIWPLWRQPLDKPATQALIDHPCLKPVDPAPAVSSTSWDALGISGVYGAQREKLPDADKFPGVLIPIQVATSR